MSPFEKFDKPGERFSKKISVWKQGVIHISKGTMNHFSLKGLDYCTLHYDLKTNRVGLQFVGSKSIQGVIKLSHRDVGAVIPSKSFFDYYQLNYTPSRQYILEQDLMSGLLVFDLGAPLEDGYAEHADSHNAEQAISALFKFKEEHNLELKPHEAATIGRYLFEAGTYLNLDEAAIINNLNSILFQAKKDTLTAPPAIPLGKKVFDLLKELL